MPLLVVAVVLLAEPAEAVICASCSYINGMINYPFYWLDCELFGGSIWGQC